MMAELRTTPMVPENLFAKKQNYRGHKQRKFFDRPEHSRTSNEKGTASIHSEIKRRRPDGRAL